MTLADSWTVLLTELAAAVPTPMATFRPGNSEAEIDRLELVVGRPLPAEVREFLRLQGGQDDPRWMNGSINFQHFMTIDEMIAEHEVMADISADWSWPQEQPSHYAWSGWSPGWLKFMSFQGDGFTLDLDPGELGTVGQVFFRPNVPDLEPPLATSIGGFLDLLIARLREGDYEIENETVYFA